MRPISITATSFLVMGFFGSMVYAQTLDTGEKRRTESEPTVAALSAFAIIVANGEAKSDIWELESGDFLRKRQLIIWGAEGDDFIWQLEADDFLHEGKSDIWGLAGDVDGDSDFRAEEDGDFLWEGKSRIWGEESGDFIWELEGDDF